MWTKLVDHIVDTVKLWWSNRSSGPEPEGERILAQPSTLQTWKAPGPTNCEARNMIQINQSFTNDTIYWSHNSVSDLWQRTQSKLQAASQGWRNVYTSRHLYIYIPYIQGVTKHSYLQNAAGATAHLLNQQQPVPLATGNATRPEIIIFWSVVPRLSRIKRFQVCPWGNLAP